MNTGIDATVSVTCKESMDAEKSGRSSSSDFLRLFLEFCGFHRDASEEVEGWSKT